MEEPGLFDISHRQQKLSKMKGFFDQLNQFVDWEVFRPIIEEKIRNYDKSKGGRPPFDTVLMFKICVIQHYNNLSDEMTEYTILDSLTFMRFLGLEFYNKVPDARTIWHFREKILSADMIDLLFNKLNDIIDKNGLIAKKGQIIDATFVQVPRQKFSKDEQTALKEGKTPETWTAKKAAHKDMDAKWTKKNNKSFFGYKFHASADNENKIIRKYQVTDASVHDSQKIIDLLDEIQEDRSIWADSAYRSKDIEQKLNEKGFISQINERSYRNKPLTESQKQSNKQKSKIRARIEHVFGYMNTAMNGLYVRTVGIVRAKFKVMMYNMCYNMSRLVLALRTQNASA